MITPSASSAVAWDERNAVEIRRHASYSDISHEAPNAYEFVIPPNSGGHLDITALYLPRKSETLIVTFHGSLQRSKYQLPRFEWRQSLAPFDAAQLFVADSTLSLDPALALSWYIGPAEQDLTADVAHLVRSIALAAGYKRVLLAGSSGGGFAALAVSRRIEGSVSVCFSPQTRVGDYHVAAVNKFRSVAFPQCNSYAEVESKFRTRVDLRHLYDSTPDVNFVRYVQNTRDLGHYNKHYAPFSEGRGVSPTIGGLDESGRFEFFPQRLQEGHQPPSRGRFRSHILAAHKTFFGVELGGLGGEALPKVCD